MVYQALRQLRLNTKYSSKCLSVDKQDLICNVVKMAMINSAVELIIESRVLQDSSPASRIMPEATGTLLDNLKSCGYILDRYFYLCILFLLTGRDHIEDEWEPIKRR